MMFENELQESVPVRAQVLKHLLILVMAGAVLLLIVGLHGSRLALGAAIAVHVLEAVVVVAWRFFRRGQR